MLSAIEGLEVATPFFQPVVVPLTVGILFGLFLGQATNIGLLTWNAAKTKTGTPTNDFATLGFAPLSLALAGQRARVLLTVEEWHSMLTARRLNNAVDALSNHPFGTVSCPDN